MSTKNKQITAVTLAENLESLLLTSDLRANLEVILPMREVEVPRRGEASDAAACCDRLGEAGGPL